MRKPTIRQNIDQHHQDVEDGTVDDRWVLPLPVLQPESPDLNQWDNVLPIAVNPRWHWWGYTKNRNAR